MWAVCAAGGGGGGGDRLPGGDGDRLPGGDGGAGRLPAPVIVVYDAVCGLYVLQEAVEAVVTDYQEAMVTDYQEAMEALADYLRRLLCMTLYVGCMCCRRRWRRW